MTIDDVLKLVDAGFTREEIIGLTTGSTSNTSAAEVDTTANEGVTTDHSEGNNAGDDAPAPAQSPNDDITKAMGELKSQVQMLIKAQQASNRAGTSSATPKPQTTDEIIAALINPTV